MLSTGVFLFKDRLIIVRADEAPLFEGRPFIKIQSVQDVFLKLIYRAIAHFVEHLRVINMISDELEQQINLAMENKYLLNLFTLEKSLVYYLSAINSNGVLIEKLRNNAAKLGFGPGERRVPRRYPDREQPVPRPDRDLLPGAFQPDGRPRLDHQQQPQRADQGPHDHHHRHHAADADRQHLLDERPIPLEPYHHAFWIITALAGVSVAVIAVLWRKYHW